MTDAFDPALRALAHEVAKERGVRVQEGVYLGLLGPSFETPAEIRAFRAWGADTVAMSVVEEVIAARQTGMRVLGISLVSNMAAGVGAVGGVGGASPDGEEVMDVAKKREADFARLVTGILERLSRCRPSASGVLPCRDTGCDGMWRVPRRRVRARRGRVQ